MATRIKLRRDSKDEWESVNPVLAFGEIGIEYYDYTDNEGTPYRRWRLKVGDGVTPWNDLDYAEVGIVRDATLDGQDLG